MEDIHPRVSYLEREMHTLKHRMDSLDSEKLPHRVTSLESAVVKMTESMKRVETGVEDLKKDLAKQKVWVALIVAGTTGGAELFSFVQEFLK